MTYKLTTYFSYQNNNKFHLTKKELFEFIDDFGFKFVQSFQKNNERGIYLGKETFYNKDSGYESYSNVYLNGQFILQDIHGYSVDFTSIEIDYNKSRDIKKYQYKRYNHNYGTKKYSKPRRRASLQKEKSVGFSKEYKESFIAKEFDVKIRVKRYKDVKKKHIFFYDDPWYRKSSRSWKNKKIKKQWNKKA